MKWYEIIVVLYGVYSLGMLIFGLHLNGMADYAMRSGRTQSDFIKGANDNANNFWFLLVITGVVWYFVDNNWWTIALGITTVRQIGNSITCSLLAKKLA